MKLLTARKMSKGFVYKKIVIVFIAFLIPLISMNIWVNYKGMSLTKNAILDSSLAGASFYSKQLDKEMYFIRNLQLQFLSDKDLQKLSFRGSMLENYERVALIDQVRDRLTTLLISSDYVINAGVYVSALGKTISSMKGVTNTPNEEFRLISSMMSTTPKPSFYRDGDRIFFIETENNGGTISYIEISKPKLLEALNQIATLYKESEVLLGNSNLGSIMSTAMDNQESEAISDLIDDQSVRNSINPVIKQLHGTSYFIIQNDVGSMDLSLIMYVNQREITRTLSQFITWFYTLFGIAIVIMVLYSFSLSLLIHRPLSKLVKAFHMIETDNLNIVIESKTKDEFHYLFHSFNRMAFNLKRSIEENYEQKIALQHSQLKQLQSQINPHFLYNSFFNIYMMCKVGDSENAAELSQKLGSYYQYITRSGSDEVPLYKEYRHALDYCEIQCIRFSNRIRYEYDEIPDESNTISVPRLMIQPIVENVFEHAFEDGTVEGVVYIRANCHNGVVRIIVEDNGNLLTTKDIEVLREKLAMDSKQMEKTGLINVNNRLQLKYGAESGLFVSRSQYGGLKVELVIMNKNENEEA
ncbi:sensor histidine kinase [Paenibacillus macquariensis]|uniref:Two-component system, sensor histidine kinase YesM n=1 Tax=Paenibacillus macquariensis TaxID=948756 RepID=A0ABY1JP30_9BACL|nr:histidine kinase [Paenibacillus macquariensis]MEC0092050.1 histidine kinase [Paenibacillus macquariensis]OAB37380.1 two-component sensor histidine kinase [Paenibacillus macquariensis subsp. macquariensis]SIQ52029.1 two-component system, sensor histidine kinase YesM [Paenibacillus macquariensis]